MDGREGSRQDNRKKGIRDTTTAKQRFESTPLETIDGSLSS